MRVGLLMYEQSGTWIELGTNMSEDSEIGESKTVQRTFTTPEIWNGESIICYSRQWTTEGSSPVGYDTFEITDLKLEKGNKATDWSPAPEDIDEKIDNAQASADDAKNKAETAKKDITEATLKINDLEGPKSVYFNFKEI